MYNNSTITQNDITNQNNSQIPYFARARNPCVDVIIQPYGNPIIKGEQNKTEIIKNSNEIEQKKQAYLKSKKKNEINKYKTKPIETICPNCKEFMITNVKLYFNPCSLCLCIFVTLAYIIPVILGNNDCLCCDAIHTCSKCGEILGYYKSVGYGFCSTYKDE